MRFPRPEVRSKALVGLKSKAALLERLATATIAARLADLTGAEQTLTERSRFVVTAWVPQGAGLP